MSRVALPPLLCAMLAGAPAAVACTHAWTVQDGSRLGFVASWEGTQFDGVFHRFDADLCFDPADLPGSRLTVEVDVTSAATRSSDRDEGLADPEWFDTARFPRATFVASTFRALGDGRYETTGTLTLKGVSREVALPFSWQEHDGTARMQGETTLVRTDFAVGEGEWADGEIVGLDVRVKVDVALAARSGDGREE